MKNRQKLDDDIFTKTEEQLRKEYKEQYGQEPEPLTEKEKREYGLIK